MIFRSPYPAVEIPELPFSDFVFAFEVVGVLLVTAALGALVFGNVPDGWTGIGATIIIASGLYTAHRERMLTQAGRRPGPPALRPPS